MIRRTAIRIGIIALGATPLVVIAGLWQWFGNPRSTFFPRPSQWVTALGQLPAYGSTGIWFNTGVTLVDFVCGLFVATLVGSLVGLGMGRVRLADRSLSITSEFLRAMPAAAVLPVFVLVLGYTNTMTVALTAFASLWPVLLSVRSAVLDAHPRFDDVARVLALPRGARLWKIELPALMPALTVGVRIAAPLALIVTLLAEILSGVQGLGVLISKAESQFESAQLYGLVLLASGLALVVNGVAIGGERFILRRHGLERA